MALEVFSDGLFQSPRSMSVNGVYNGGVCSETNLQMLVQGDQRVPNEKTVEIDVEIDESSVKPRCCWRRIADLFALTCG